MSELAQKVRTSIERLKSFEPKNGEGYYLAFSGGKDSVVCKALLDMSGIKYDAHYRVTSVDPPELVIFIKERHPDVIREKPMWDPEYKNPSIAGRPITMWNLIPEMLMPPTRIARYCCKKLKESGGDGRLAVTGVRWAEGVNRRRNHGPVTIADKKAGQVFSGDTNFHQTDQGGVVLTNDNDESRRMIETCYQRMKTVVNPIIDWTDDDVWDFIRSEHIPYCGLYDCGFHRLGCIECPMARQHGREKQFARWPKYKQAYLLAFSKMLDERKRRGLVRGTFEGSGATPKDVFNWWMEYDVIPGQIDIFELIEESETYYW